MQRLFRSLTVMMVVAALAGSALAKETKASKAKQTPASTYIDKMIKSVTGLTDDQTKKLDALKDEYNPKLKDAYAKLDSVLTADQVKAGKDAQKSAKAEGKKGKDVTAAVADAEKITDDQKKQITGDKAAVSALQKELAEKVKSLLTDEQKAQLKPKKAAK